MDYSSEREKRPRYYHSPQRSSSSSSGSRKLARHEHEYESQPASYSRSSNLPRPLPGPTRVSDQQQGRYERPPTPPSLSISELIPDYDIHSSELDSIFFSSSASIFRVGSSQWTEFIEFYNKLRAVRVRKAQSDPNASSSSLPSVSASRLSSIHERRQGHGSRLLPEQIHEFKVAIVLYQDFQQKKEKAKIDKIKSDRESLPIYSFKEQILEAIQNNQVVVIGADTGAGKSTQIPQYLLAAGYSRIACTQPRRISAMSLCRRVSFESLNEYSSQVAYQIRFESSKTRRTRILFLTEGLLLRQIIGDPLLLQYDVIIIDEVHERHVSSDMLLAVLKSILPKRPTLKLILMSATINFKLFSDYFASAPVICVPGRLHPITLEYFPTDESLKIASDLELLKQRAVDASTNRSSIAVQGKKVSSSSSSMQIIDPKPYLRILERIDQEYPAEERGDVLVFMSGVHEIQCLCEELQRYAEFTKRWIVLPLHSQLAVEEQEKVFDIPPDGVRKCIVSTNIAETSVTIDGIRFVIDSGKVKEMGYEHETGLQSLQEYWVSQASADQRKGRAGRTGPGRCFRLYSKAEFEHFLAFSVPEIDRVPLESLVLQIKALGMGDPRAFPLIEPPPLPRLERAISALKQHEALRANDANETLSPLGRALSQLPVDISLGKMLVLGAILGLSDSVCTLAAALSVPCPFLRSPTTPAPSSSSSSAPPQYLPREASRGSGGGDKPPPDGRSEFESPDGDPFTIMQLFDAWIGIKQQNAQKGSGSGSGGRGSTDSRRWCKSKNVEEQRLYEMARLKQQFRDLLKDIGLASNSFSATGSSSSRKEKEAGEEEDERDGDGDRERGRDNRGDERWTREAKERDRERGQMRRELRRLQTERERETGKRMLRMSDDGTVTSISIGKGGKEQQGTKKEGEGEGPEEYHDLKHMHFMVSCDVNQLASQQLTRLEINVLKHVLCAGMYPNFAFFEEGPGRRPGDPCFITRSSSLVCLHPSSILYSKEPFLTSTEIFVYKTLLETNKTYLTNVTRAPAVHSLLLYAQTIDTNSEMTRLLVDDQIEVSFFSKSLAEKALLSICQLRASQRYVLRNALGSRRAASAIGALRDSELQLENLYPLAEDVPEAVHLIRRAWIEAQEPKRQDGDDYYSSLSRESLELSRCIGEFFEVELKCKVRRLKLDDKNREAASSGKEPIVEKAGIAVTPFLRYCGIVDQKTAANPSQHNVRLAWRCPKCESGFLFTEEEKKKHLSECA